MAFKKRKKSSVSLDSCESLLRDLRVRKIEGPLAHQADIWRDYHRTAQALPDVALQLPTGSGKTLVGVILAEWRRLKFRERTVFLCPTRQLVHQVVAQAETYGVRATPFVGSIRSFSSEAKSAYRSAETLAVTTYSALFNTNPFFDNPNTIVLDDAHAAENYVASNWSLEIVRSDFPDLFEAALSLFHDALSESDYLAFLEEDDRVAGWTEKIPTPWLYKHASELIGFFDEHTQNSDLEYPWSQIRSALTACHIYVSQAQILIRPLIPPTHTHAPFHNATQRIYMSATLGEGGELERLWGRDRIHRLPVSPAWERQGIGRRFFLFPETKLNADETSDFVQELIQHSDRVLILTPSRTSAERLEQQFVAPTGYTIVSASEMERSKNAFTKAKRVATLLPGRYDGIDLIGDECRLLIVHGLPRATNLQEHFLVSRLGAGVLLQDRIITRTTQAVGRCTRSSTDYSAVVVLGDELNKFFLTAENRRLLHPEIRAEVEFGIDQSRDATAADLVENYDLFIRQGDEWVDVQGEIVSLRESYERSATPAYDKLQKSVSNEVRYQQRMWAQQYDEALDAARSVLSQLGGEDVRGYRAFWCYLAGNAALLASKHGAPTESVARDYYRKAAAGGAGIRWLSSLARRTPTGDAGNSLVELETLNAVVEGIERSLDSLGTYSDRRFEPHIVEISNGLSSSDSDAFESAHMRLGAILGYEVGNSNDTAAPDPWWIAGGRICIVFEDHTPEAGDGVIGANKIRQAASHPNWIRANVTGLAVDVEILPVIVSPRREIDDGSRPHVGELCHWPLDDFRAWAFRAITAIRELRRDFPGVGDLEWRRRAAERLRDDQIAPRQLVEMLRRQRLS